MPRVLRGVADRDLSATLLGHHLSLPVVLAPVGSIQMFHPEGSRPPARVAERAGTLSFVATNATPSLEEARAVSGGPLVYQLYVYGDREWQKDMLRRIENAGYDALCLTVDGPDSGVRDRRFANRQVWAERANGEAAAGLRATSAAERQRYLAGLTWDDVAWLRDQTRLPMIFGTVLVAINQGTVLAEGVLPAALLWKIPLTYAVPFCVATWGALSNSRA